MTPKHHKNKLIIQLLCRLWRQLTVFRKKQIILFLLLMLLTSIAEVFTLGMIVPFLAALASPEKVFNHSSLAPLFEFLGLNTPTQILYPLTIIFSGAAILSGFMRLLLLRSITKVSFAFGSDLAAIIYRKTLYQPYEVHLIRNTSEIVSAISTKITSITSSVIIPAINLISSGFMLLLISSALFYIDPLISSIVFLVFSILYFIISKAVQNKKIANSEVVSRQSSAVIKALQEGLGGIRDILLDGSQETFCKIFQKADFALRKAQSDNLIMAQSPRFLLESFGIVIIAVISLFIVTERGDIAGAIPVLGALAMGAQRLLPLMQLIYASWSLIQGSYRSIEDTLDLLDQPLPKYIDKHKGSLVFKKSLRLDAISFGYLKKELILKNISMEIVKGSRVGFIGLTGSGKTTLLDVVMGFLLPQSGRLLVDNKVINDRNRRAWQSHVAHVPQSIFLSDASIAENIAFGVATQDIDYELVAEAASCAQLGDFINQLPDGYKTSVGERGVRLSGGQRQRIGIARALYKQPDVLIFDEATSALDSKTEKLVMNTIQQLSNEITVLIIAHRLSTLKVCNKIVELSEGKVSRVGTFNEIVESD